MKIDIHWLACKVVRKGSNAEKKGRLNHQLEQGALKKDKQKC